MSSTNPERRRGLDALVGFLAAIGAAIVLITIKTDWAILVVPFAGVIAGGLTRDRTPGLSGLVAGLLILSTMWGAMIVVHQIESCQPECGGLSSPGITVAIAVVTGLTVEVVAVAGFIVGRLARRVVGPGRTT